MRLTLKNLNDKIDALARLAGYTPEQIADPAAYGGLPAAEPADDDDDDDDTPDPE